MRTREHRFQYAARLHIHTLLPLTYSYGCSVVRFSGRWVAKKDPLAKCYAKERWGLYPKHEFLSSELYFLISLFLDRCFLNNDPRVCGKWHVREMLFVSRVINLLLSERKRPLEHCNIDLSARQTIFNSGNLASDKRATSGRAKHQMRRIDSRRDEFGARRRRQRGKKRRKRRKEETIGVGAKPLFIWCEHLHWHEKIILTSASERRPCEPTRQKLFRWRLPV